MSCDWCDDGRCDDADLAPLMVPELEWLWTQLAARADRRGDPLLVEGVVHLRMPEPIEQRASAVGLLGGTPLRAGQDRAVDLADLTLRLRVRGVSLTPGVVAAHATRRRLGVRIAAQTARREASEELRRLCHERLVHLPAHLIDRVNPDTAWERLVAGRWIGRLLGREEPSTVLAAAFDVLDRLPVDSRIDRRVLVPGDPHALDDGQTLGALVLFLCRATVHRGRAGWSDLGVDTDDLVGGLICLGLLPLGWTAPPDAVLTVPPRELKATPWTPPRARGQWAFVTENPSVLAAAQRLVAAPNGEGAPIAVACTAGTPSEIEAAGVARLVDAGWRLAVRADFDRAGLAHVRTLLAAAPAAVPWRMRASDYRRCLRAPTTGLVIDPTETPWDPKLAMAITDGGSAAYEEDLLDLLLGDLRAGRPRAGRT